MDSMQDRLDRLARSVRRLQLALLAAVACVAVAFTTSAGGQDVEVTPERLRVRELQIVADDGTCIASITNHEGEGLFASYKEGRVVSTLGRKLNIFSPKHDSIACSIYEIGGCGAVSLLSEHQPLLHLGSATFPHVVDGKADPDIRVAGGVVYVFDSDGRVVGSLLADGSNRGCLIVRDSREGHQEAMVSDESSPERKLLLWPFNAHVHRGATETWMKALMEADRISHELSTRK